MSFLESLKERARSISSLQDQIDTEDAAIRIRNGIWFRGPNVWILAFSIIIASVGLNVNSTAVIIGAMLISPLMGPIIGMGLSLGTNDTALLKDAFRNLVVMVLISLLASFLYFLLTPLDLANPTELEARTSPTIYDVLIALFGGLAGILENCRKEKGTVLAGVAIATALMPPLCTAGYGLANGNWQFFIGAMFLFLINGIFIILATYIMVKNLGFKEVKFLDAAVAKKTKTMITLITLAVMIPSIWSAFVMIRKNNFQRNIQALVSESRSYTRGYIYDWKAEGGKSSKVTLYITGEPLNESEKQMLLVSAEKFGLSKEQIEIKAHIEERNDSEKLIKGIYERTDVEIGKKDARIKELEAELASLKTVLPYDKIAREARFQYPEIQGISITKGAKVQNDTLTPYSLVTVTSASGAAISDKTLSAMEAWLRVRLEDSTVVVINPLKQ